MKVAKIQLMGYCYLNNSEPYLSSIRPATPRTELRLRTAHPGGFLLFRCFFDAGFGENRP